MKSRRDGKILDLSPTRTQILKGWHDMCAKDDTPSELFGCDLKHEDALQNTHLGRIRI